MTAEDLALLSDEELEQLDQRVLAEQKRRRDKERAERDRNWEVLGKDTTATCLAHRRTVRWEPAPCWWYHESRFTGEHEAPESRQCRALWNAKAPIAIFPRVHADTK